MSPETAVPWNDLRCNCGHHSGEHLPKAVKDFFSSVLPSSTKRAYWKLENHIVTQGYIDESAPYTIDLLLIEVRNRYPKVPRALYELLFELSNGQSNCNIACGHYAGQPVELATKMRLKEFLPYLDHAAGNTSDNQLKELCRETIENIQEGTFRE